MASVNEGDDAGLSSESNKRFPARSSLLNFSEIKTSFNETLVFVIQFPVCGFFFFQRKQKYKTYGCESVTFKCLNPTVFIPATGVKERAGQTTFVVNY